jgi:threonylcarbamoyladenosine tRNA methylthiotransferase MtaB
VDVIVGFPGETDEEFRATYDFINSLDVSYLHVFTYSERANTRALNITPIVPKAVRKERNEMLRILSEKKRNMPSTSSISIRSVR